jgi:hypothetical protein
VFPDVFLKMFPVAPGFYGTWFAQSSTIWTEKVSYKGINLFLFWNNWVFKEVFPLGSAQCSKKVDDGLINMVLSKREKKSYGRIDELINMNHTMSHSCKENRYEKAFNIHFCPHDFFLKGSCNLVCNLITQLLRGKMSVSNFMGNLITQLLG